MLFNELYERMGQFLLEEGVLDEIPAKVKRMSTSVQDLPDKKPYGFWVDRSGNFLEVPFYGHDEGASDIISRANKYLKDRGQEYPDYNGVYKEMFRNGYIRVAIGGGHNVYYNTGYREDTSTTSQKRFVSFCKDLYDLEGVKFDGKTYSE